MWPNRRMAKATNVSTIAIRNMMVGPSSLVRKVLMLVIRTKRQTGFLNK